MKCTNRFLTFVLIIAMVLSLSGCGNLAYDRAYTAGAVSGANHYKAEENKGKAESFASDLCVVTNDILKDDVQITNAGSAALFDLKNRKTIYAKSVHEKMFPASLTKVMTALVALENGSLDQILTATDAVKITESGAATIGLKAGDTMTLDQALHILLIASANDVGLMIGENISGSVDGFVAKMNEKAQQLGAMNTHFTNPHGLHNTENYTTAYDMYLIFSEALKYDAFHQIIGMTNYQTTYYDKNNSPKEVSYTSTNKFFRGQFNAPANVTVLGGKTGTTNAAGHCLVLLSKDVKGNSYISVLMRCSTSDILYEEMIELLEEINK